MAAYPLHHWYLRQELLHFIRWGFVCLTEKCMWQYLEYCTPWSRRCDPFQGFVAVYETICYSVLVCC
jgi:hypothetical protein